ncbi:MAG: hypothetical protein WBX15_08270 [Thermoanaerobaculia bacterium]
MEQLDKKSVGLTAETQTLVEEIEQTGWFLEGQDIAHFALSYAIRKGVTPGNTKNADTRWAVGNFDASGEIRTLLTALYPECETPVRLMEHLVNEGLQLVAERIRSEAVGPAELMG